MNKAILVICILLSMCLASFALAQTDHDSHAGHGTAQSAEAALEPAVTPEQAHAGHDMGRQGKMMQEHMQAMREKMAGIKETKNRRKRMEMVSEYMDDMDRGLAMMKEMPMCPMMSARKQADENQTGEEGQGMMGKGMMGKGMMGKGMMGQGMMGQGMMGQGMMACQQMMQTRMEMMQAMMEGLVEAARMKE